MPEKNDILERLRSERDRHILRHEWESAMQVVDRMIALSASASSYTRKAMLQVKLGRYEAALASLQRALQIDPAYMRAHDLRRRLSGAEKQLGQTPQNGWEELVSPFEITYTDLEIVDIATNTGKQDNNVNATLVDTATRPSVGKEPSMAAPAPMAPGDTSAPSAETGQHLPAALPCQFGRYQIRERLGGGGMGEVYKVYDPQLDRVAALKVLAGSMSQDDARFWLEAKATAKLRHPSIVALYDTGQEDGRSYFTMEFIEGLSFKDFLHQTPPPGWRQIIEILVKVCDAVHYAHSQGIIHRDLKPSNIMVKKDGEPKIMDFGVAKLTRSLQEELTRSGQVIGTPAYMSPEQAEGKPVDARSDVYSLGATLYEAITQRAPFQGESTHNILYQVFHCDPLAPRAIKPEIPVELEAICLKSLEKTPAYRYADAQSLAQDLRNFLDYRPIFAKPPTLVSKMRKFMQRNRLVVGSAFLIFAVVVIGAIFSIWQWRKAELARTTAEQERRQATLRLADIALDKAREAIGLENWRACGVLAGTSLDLTKNMHGPEVRAMRDEAKSLIRATLFDYGLICATSGFYANAVYQVAYSPDGSLLASAISDKTLRLWDASNGLLLRSLTGHSDRVWGVAFSPDGKLLASASWDGTAKLWNVADGRLLQNLQAHGKNVNSVAFSPDGKLLASASLDKTVIVWNVGNGEQIRTLSGHEDNVWSVRFSRCGQWLVTASADKTVRLWDVASGKQIQMMSGHASEVQAACYSPDGLYVASGSWDKTVKIWQTASGKLVHTLSGHNDRVWDVTFSPDGNLVASSSWDKTARVWDCRSGFLLRTFTGHSNTVWSVAFSPDGQRLVTAEKSIRVWNLRRGIPIRLFTGHSNTVWSVAFSPHGRELATASWDGSVRIWDAFGVAACRTLNGHTNSVWSVVFSPDGRQLASASWDNSVRLWDAQSGLPLANLQHHNQGVYGVSYSPDGRYLASASVDKNVVVWDVERRAPLRTLQGHTGSVYAVCFSPDGGKLASASWDNVIVWDSKTGKRLRTLSGHNERVWSLAFHPAGRLLASASSDKTVMFWDYDSGKRLRSLIGHSERVWAVRFSPDGKLVASASDDKTIRLWDARTGAQLRTLPGHLDSVAGLAFSPDGKTLASVSADKSVRLWNLGSADDREPGPVNLAFWSKSFLPLPAELAALSRPSAFDFRADIPGWLIEYALDRQPLLLTQCLFESKVTETFAVEPLELVPK